MPLLDRRAPIGVIFGVLASGLVVAPAGSQTVGVERLSDRVLVASPPLLGHNNVVAVSTKKGLVLIDTGASPFVAGELKREVEKRLGRTDWAYVINTHGHDHAGGNVIFKNVPTIAHQNIVVDMKQLADALASEEKKAPSLKFIRGKKEELQKELAAGKPNDAEMRAKVAFWQGFERDVVNGFELATPNLRISEELTLDMGDLTVQALYFGRGHSLSDVVVYIPEEKLLVSGGVCNPYIPKVADHVRLEDLTRSISVLDRVLEGGVEHVVAGHAEVLGPEVVSRLRDYYRDLVANTAAVRGQGLTVEQAQAQLTLDQRFPYMRSAKVRRGTREELHAANVAAVWKLGQQ